MFSKYLITVVYHQFHAPNVSAQKLPSNLMILNHQYKYISIQQD